MNVIFLTLSNITSIEERGIYADLLRKFRNEGHNVYIVKPFERRIGRRTELKEDKGAHILGVKVLNIQKTNIIEKGIGTLLLEKQYKLAIERYLKNIRFDLILYSTPPITLIGAIEYLKQRNPHAITYLLLKDIFPQNAVDIQMIAKDGFMYKLFRKKEIRLYKVSDYIGCMSPANCEFVIKHNSFVDPVRVELAPNSIELSELSAIDKSFLGKKYNLPLDKPIFIYGGNLGKPQGIEFLIQCLEANKDRTDCFFLIVGNGTEYNMLHNWMKDNQPSNISLIARLPKNDYDTLVRSCDVGLIFLDYRFLIPNFPSRLLSYLENKMPIVVATDPNTDMGLIAEKNGFGKACLSNNVDAFTQIINNYVNNPELISEMGNKGYDYLCGNYLVENTYNPIMRHFSK